MIRFSPDSLLEALLRPVVMALPQGWVYTEITAPDLRFAWLLLLCLACPVVSAWHRRRWSVSTPVVTCLLLFPPAFALWLASGGNGRYFMPYILLVGVASVGVLYAAPFTRPMRLTMLALIMVLQSGAVWVNSPWQPFDSLEWIRWRTSSYFDVDVSAIERHENVMYVTFAGQSHSFVAPYFPASSKWMNLSSFEGRDFLAGNEPVVRGARRRLRESQDIRVMLRSQPRQAEAETGLPNKLALESINGYLAQFGLSIKSHGLCWLLPSKSLGAMTMLVSSDTPEEITKLKSHAGFWVCQLAFSGTRAATAEGRAQTEHAKEIIGRVEQLCPRLFPPGQQELKRVGYGFIRSYSESDATLTYVVTEGVVYVKFLRALNPQRIGVVDEILHPSFQLRCDGFISREGLPWMRDL